MPPAHLSGRHTAFFEHVPGSVRMRARVDWSGEATLKASIASRRPSLAYVALASLVGAFIWIRWGGIRKGIWVDLDVYVSGAALKDRKSTRLNSSHANISYAVFCLK